MNESSPYTRRQWVRAVNLSAVLGWLAVTGPSLGPKLPFLIYAAIFGLPIAFLVSWVITAPILKRVMRRSVSWSRAIVWGGALSLFFAAVSIAVGRYFGWRESVDPNSWSQIGGGAYIREIDGILTPYGWWRLALSTEIFVCSGIVIALILRAIIGPGLKTQAQEATSESPPLP